MFKSSQRNSNEKNRKFVFGYILMLPKIWVQNYMRASDSKISQTQENFTLLLNY